MNIEEQIDSGKLICPKNGSVLRRDGNGGLVSMSGGETYRLLEGNVPLLLIDPARSAAYASQSERMLRMYNTQTLQRADSLFGRFKARLLYDYRSVASVNAMDRVLSVQAGNPLLVSVGGGPQRPHPLLTNVNIARFPNVDLIADAHNLPYAAECADGIYCNAVLEHLERPAEAVAHMFRILKPGARVFAVTPFMQAYHGYPFHFHNFTTTGHGKLFEHAGFTIEEVGVAVGPTYTMVSLTSTFINEYFPHWTRPLGKLLWGSLGAGIRPLDKILNRRDNAGVLASTTYVVAKKP